MFAIRVLRVFSAAHALLIRGERETIHGHDWRLTVTLAGAALDDDGLLCDFHEVERIVDAIIAPFHNANLNDVEPFTMRNPSAENVARFIGDAVVNRCPKGLAVESVELTEAPGCEAIYRPE